ncbi:type I phosphodiesterase/nucleotide pyrophosphatase [Histoplasma capsulatum var. duboisii H88]|uniref:Type I phosphodiesterase/nucleotide pyrophosphatase n=1 Tax=Ajellomyces capsulatus (strain H88) TaxID=544711 RepID=F0U720_AJEC8|nr:type I phosphodiesterase/nucleotide pyrophosphatase [Histoplasma capsulatum var. duboisii H88]QSS52861.1 type I phosphodiesterase/nucleotide pyrophosphatase [Histoplasma capsulatum var. duboisii H88]
MPLRKPPPSPSLLSPTAYDDDVDTISLRSLSDQDSDSEDDELIKGSRTTLELSQHDRTVLEEEEERERLLVKQSPTHGLRRIFGHDNGSSVRIGKQERRRQRRLQRRADRIKRMEEKGEEMGLMFEMEEGNIDDNTSSHSSGGSSILIHPGYKSSRGSWCFKVSILSTGIVVLFLILYLGAYKESSSFRSARQPRTLLSNGTSLFAPTTILISLDGFRADFLNRGLTPALNSFIANGISPAYMLPSFPSVTFPNHFTLVTGLYPESHGIVGNSFWDPVLREDFYYTDPARSLDPKWWTAEPVWVTAEKQGVRTAIHMWPGSEAHIGNIEPTYLDKFNAKEDLASKAKRVLSFLDLPGDQEAQDLSSDTDRRPQLIAVYVPHVDSDGHTFGPNSTEIRSTLARVDEMLAEIFKGLHSRNLTDVVNIVVVSDHGMATTSTDRLVQLDDIIDVDLVDRLDGWPLQGIRPKRPEDLEILKQQLAESSKQYNDSIDVYTRETMPDRYHFSSNDRIAPLWVVPKTGWAVVEKSTFNVQDAKMKKTVYHPRGLHGYDHEHPLMRAIFVARGPKFPHHPNSRVENFQNTEVYNIICDSLEIEAHPNNGTLRLPLNPIGFHSPEDFPSANSPDDPPVNTGPSSAVITSKLQITASSNLPTTILNSGSPDPTSTPKHGEKDTSASTSSSSLWDKFLDRIQWLKNWAQGFLDSVDR